VRTRLPQAVAALVAGALTAAALAAPAAAAPKTGYTVTNLVSDMPGVAANTDPHLQNAWGLDEGPTTPWWVADNQTDVSTLYNASGAPQPAAPQPLVVDVAGGPTGLVFNTTSSSFTITDSAGDHGKAFFLFDG
jgi:hypothetical protein